MSINVSPFVVSPEWLLNELNNPDLVIIDCRFKLGEAEYGYHQYLASHIPNSYYLDLEKDLSDDVTIHGGRHPLPKPEIFGQTLSNLGVISPETLVIAYDNSRFAFAARFWWMLRYYGHQKVAILDGGWNGWKSLGYPVTNTIPLPKQGLFIPQIQADKIVDIKTVQARQNNPNSLLIDSREHIRYRGEFEPIDPIAGHIRGAVNSPWQLVTNEQGFLCPLPQQQQLWLNYQQAQEIIVYCGSGVTACVNILSLELVGYSQTKLYVGGWSDWCSYILSSDKN